MLTFAITAHFAKGYIGHPYWPEMDRLVTIQKQSGMNRARSGANRRKSLEEYLRGINMTLIEYDELEKLAQRPFVVDNGGAIIIPQNHVESFLVATCDEVRAATRPCEPNQVRTRMLCTHWETGKTASDGVWERYVVANSGTGAKLSNQRRHARNDYISEFDATGRISFDEEFVNPKTLRQAIEWGGMFVGIGASRKMGWGRFELRAFDNVVIPARIAAE